MLERISKRKMFALYRRLLDREFQCTGWSKKTERNGRGAYGLTETFSLNGTPLFVISYDGARIDVQFFADWDAVEKAAKKRHPRKRKG